ncbi:MAG: hypothetical protein BGO57_03660 [Sphingomonadales bacterium 63-6]|nr:MAG: hypothetical protein BGO57_03660 [Sphingomonadales bacterium 63-6]
MHDVEGKVAFITGGASGIGFGMARQFLDAGMKVVIADFSDANLEDAQNQLSGTNREYMMLKLDVRDRAAYAAAADAAEERFGKIHVLCNNAGIGTGAPLAEATFEDWDFLMNINVGGVINGVVTVLPRIRRHGEGGHIVNTSSIAGVLPLPDPGGMYTTTKFAVRGLSDSLRLALVDDRIGVSCLFPGLTRTRILDAVKDKNGNPAADLDEVSKAFVLAQQYAMDPYDLGRAVLDAVRQNKPYIIAHKEFAEEMDDLHREMMDTIRTDMPYDSRRGDLEASRREHIRALKARMEAW